MVTGCGDSGDGGGGGDGGSNVGWVGVSVLSIAWLLVMMSLLAPYFRLMRRSRAD
jgi:hypothetical protein